MEMNVEIHGCVPGNGSSRDQRYLSAVQPSAVTIFLEDLPYLVMTLVIHYLGRCLDYHIY